MNIDGCSVKSFVIGGRDAALRILCSFAAAKAQAGARNKQGVDPLDIFGGQYNIAGIKQSRRNRAARIQLLSPFVCRAGEMSCGLLLNRGNAVSIPTPYGKHAFDRLLLAVGAAIEAVYDTGIIFDFDKHQWGWLGTLAVNDGRKVGPFCLSIKEKATKSCVISGITAAVFTDISGGKAASYAAPGDGGQLLGTSGKHYVGVECDCIGDDMLIITDSDRNIALFGAFAFAFKRELDPAESSVTHKADMPERPAAKAELFGKAWICRFDRRIENEGALFTGSNMLSTRVYLSDCSSATPFTMAVCTFVYVKSLIIEAGEKPGLFFVSVWLP